MKPPLPSNNQPLTGAGGIITPIWQRFFNALVGSPEPIAAVGVDNSPATYTASANGFLSVSGGTISNMTFNRARITIDITGSQMVPMANNDTVTVTYSVAPALSFIPS